MQPDDPAVLDSKFVGAKIQPGDLAGLIRKVLGRFPSRFCLRVDTSDVTCFVISSYPIYGAIDLGDSCHHYGAVMKLFFLAGEEIRRGRAAPRDFVAGWLIRSICIDDDPVVLVRAVWVKPPPDWSSRRKRTQPN